MEPDQHHHTSLLISINDKVDGLKDQVYEVSLAQNRIEADLRYHILRTDLLEKKLESTDSKVEPLHNTKTSLVYFGKVIAFLLGIMAGIAAIYKNIKF